MPELYEKVEKDWGWTKCIYEVPNQYYIMEAFIKAGGKSSFGKLHKHNYYKNTFNVLAGKLSLHITYPRSSSVATRILTAEDFALGVSSNDWHSFYAHTDVQLIEIYQALPGQGVIPTIYEDTIREEAREPFARGESPSQI